MASRSSVFSFALVALLLMVLAISEAARPRRRRPKFNQNPACNPPGPITIFPGPPYILKSLRYPRNYPPNLRCRWDFIGVGLKCLVG